MPHEDPDLFYEYDTEDEAQSLDAGLLPEPGEVLDIGEVDAGAWRKFPDILTDSLWLFQSRGREGMHNGKYHGNFVPQIPYQAIRRFTKPGEVVLDPFLGSGTTLIECRRQGRHGIGIELIETIAQDASQRIQAEADPYRTWQEVITGDSTSEETIQRVRQILVNHGRSQVQLLVMHPPYHDIIHFSDDPRDLCNAHTLPDFLEAFRQVARGTYDLLQKDRFLVVVIGDKYGAGEWIPLGFHTMAAAQSVGYTLKSIVVKNMEGNRAKRNKQNLWRQRAFKGKYYIFKHEYVLFLQKTEMAPMFRRVIAFARAIDDREELNLIKDSSFVSGEQLGDLVAGLSWLSPARILALKHGQVRAIAIDLTGVAVTRSIESELEEFISRLSPKVVDVSVLVEPDKRASVRNVQGVSQVYSPDDGSVEQLAHAMYVVTKATGSGQRVGREVGVAFADSLNAALASCFDLGTEYEWGRRGVGFKFFRIDPARPFGEAGRAPNFRVGVVTKWVSGHENEKMPQIRDRFYRKEFTLVAIVGPNIERWKKLIQEQGNFADYYLFVGKGDDRSLERVIQNQRLAQAQGDGEFLEVDKTLVEFLRGEQQACEVQRGWEAR